MNSYEKRFTSAVQAGLSPTEAATRVFEFYLDGKPYLRGALKGKLAEHDLMLWRLEFLHSLPADAWATQAAILALARYIHSTRVSNLPLLEHLAVLAPATVRNAIRYSGLALSANPLRRSEIAHLAKLLPQEFDDISRILVILESAYHERLDLVEQCKVALTGLSPLEMLMYASLYACEYLLPTELSAVAGIHQDGIDVQHTWEAINNVLVWKLATVSADDCAVTEADILASLRMHLIPFINPSAVEPVRDDIYLAFRRLLVEQMELDSFINRSADAFSYDDTVAFVLNADELKIVDIDEAGRKAWHRNGERLARLHEYWFHRAMDEFIESGMGLKVPGSLQNHEANSFAWMKALRTWLQLDEVYGMEATVTTDSSLPVDLFQALLAQELMTQYFNIAFVQPYLQYYSSFIDARRALLAVAMSGMQQPGMSNLLPLTWSDRQTKIAKIIGWTVTAEFPDGSSKAAEAILDFWTSDWTTRPKHLKAEKAGLHPELFERPVLRMGSWLFQLPWMVATRNNASAAINNLRRLGARRAQARQETHRIETRLARYLNGRDLQTVTNYVSPLAGGKAAGEIDIICAGPGHVIVMEVKSTFMRRSVKDAWRHQSTTLRKAGLQLARKIAALRLALVSDPGLRQTLGLQNIADSVAIHGWIVDTSLEYDHERFNGFLKVSLEELLIALRDDAHYLRGLTSGEQPAGGRDTGPGLYPAGFSIGRLIEVIETERVWENTSGQS